MSRDWDDAGAYHTRSPGVALDDEALVQAAIDEAQASVSSGNHPFGAVLYQPGQGIVLRAQNSVITSRDPTCHAEFNLVRLAVHTRALAGKDLKGITLATSTEPCPMCAGAIYWAGIGRVVYGCPGDLLGELSGEEIAVPCRSVLQGGKLHQVEVVGPLLQETAAEAHRAFWDNWDGSHCA
eukprot:gene526-2457_t